MARARLSLSYYPRLPSHLDRAVVASDLVMIDLSTYRLNPLRKDDELVLYRGVHDAMGRSAGGSRPAPESHRPRARRYKSEPLDRLLDEPLEVGAFLPLAVGIARAGERHDAV